METSLKPGFAQIFSCCPKFGGAAAPLVPPARTPMSPGTTKIFVAKARIELTTLRILLVYRTFQPLNQRVASSILHWGMEISFVRASMVSPPSKLNVHWKCMCAAD